MNHVVKFRPAFADVFDALETFMGRDMSPLRPSFPAANVKETETAFLLELAAPGRNKADFSISVEQDLLTVGYEKTTSDEATDDNGKYTRREFSFSAFKRTFTLPKMVNTDAISASYVNGILTLTLPKKVETPKASKVINVG